MENIPPSIFDKNSPIGIKQHFCSDFYNFSYLLLVVVRLIRYEMQIFFLIRNSVIFLKENIKYKKRPGVLNKNIYFPVSGLCLVSWLRSLCYPWSAEDLDIYWIHPEDCHLYQHKLMSAKKEVLITRRRIIFSKKYHFKIEEKNNINIWRKKKYEFCRNKKYRNQWKNLNFRFFCI